MTAIAISWVRNEADIIEASVRHNLRFVSRMIVIDNGSTDDTSAILRRLQSEGLRVDLRSDPTPVHRQGPALTDLMHELHHSHDPDWILPLDADEFLRPSAASLEESLAPYGEMPVAIPWQTYVPLPSDDDTESHPLRRITWRRSIEDPLFCKIIVPKAFQNERFAIPIGSHALRGPAGVDVPLAQTETLHLAHFPVRSPHQIKRKVRDGWLRHLARDDRRDDEVFHWKDILERLPMQTLPTQEELRDIALQYSSTRPYSLDELVHDPVL